MNAVQPRLSELVETIQICLRFLNYGITWDQPGVRFIEVRIIEVAMYQSAIRVVNYKMWDQFNGQSLVNMNSKYIVEYGIT